MGIAIRPATTRQVTPPRALQSNGWLLAALVMAALALAPHPGASNQSTDDATSARALQLQIGSAGGYRLDGKPVTRDGLEQALRAARGESPELRLRIEASDSGDPQQLIGALALADHAGIRNVGSRVQ
jgi:biopolymer transport protein ExbD